MDRNEYEMDKLEMMAEFMAERRKGMQEVINWRGKKQKLREMIETSINLGDKLRETEMKMLGEETKRRGSRETGRKWKRGWRGRQYGRHGTRTSRTKTNAWE